MLLGARSAGKNFRQKIKKMKIPLEPFLPACYK
jgi:hypothetical protein